MKFEDAIKEMRNGKKIQNDYMREMKYCMFIEKGHICEQYIGRKNDRVMQCDFINAYHLFRDDWEVYNE